MRTIACLIALVVLVGCGGGQAPVVVPTRVPVELVPPKLGSLLVIENTASSTRKALANPGKATLVADTRIWEIRRGQRLVGTLQISTVLPKVDLTDVEVRERFVAQVIVGTQSRIRSGDVEVFTNTVNDKTVYLWFGQDLFEVVQTKARGIDPEDLLKEIIAFQRDKPAWKPLPELLDE